VYLSQKAPMNNYKGRNREEKLKRDSELLLFDSEEK